MIDRRPLTEIMRSLAWPSAKGGRSLLHQTKLFQMSVVILLRDARGAAEYLDKDIIRVLCPHLPSSLKLSVLEHFALKRVLKPKNLCQNSGNGCASKPRARTSMHDFLLETLLPPNRRAKMMRAVAVGVRLTENRLLRRSRWLAAPNQLKADMRLLALTKRKRLRPEGGCPNDARV